MLVSKLEKSMGIEVYATSCLGIGGVIRRYANDFVVEEVLVNGSKARIDEHGRLNEHEVSSSSSVKNKYLLCVLVKQGWDMFLALSAVAKQLGISSKRIQIAGIKDAKAVTAQHMTVEGISTEEIKKILIKDVSVHPIGYFRSKLSPYFLLGNDFRVNIRGISHSSFTIHERIERITHELEALGGAPNFFGHQRFGTTRPITHLVGRAIVKGDFERAIMIFLAKPSRHEHPESRQARTELQLKRDFGEALKSFPKKLHYERLMLKHLTKKSEDFVGAFRRLPVRLQKLFVQAYQAYLFNKFLSRRIGLGLPLNQAETGDYVLSVERSGLPMPSLYKIASTQSLNEINSTVKNGRMRLAFPLVGFKQRISQGIQGDIEKKILEEGDISSENFRIKAMPEISARGSLRSAISPLNNFLLDEISQDSIDRSRREVRLSFMLYRGSYATIILRELIKPRNPIRAGF